MRKTVIISEDAGKQIKDLLTMTQFKFKSNIKKFLASLLEDPTGTEPDMIFTQNGLDKNKLIKALVDNKVITKKMTIDDHDEEGNPHTARMIVKYSVPKERFNDRLDALYDILFPDVDGKINEETNEATGCSSVGGGGVFGGEGESYEYDYPAFTKKGKKQKNTKNVGGNPYTLNESQLILEVDSRTKRVRKLIQQEFGNRVDLNAPCGKDPHPEQSWLDYLEYSLRHEFGIMSNADAPYLELVAHLAFSDEVGFEKRDDNAREIGILQKIVALLKKDTAEGGSLLKDLNQVKDSITFSQVYEQLKPQLEEMSKNDAEKADMVEVNDDYDIHEVTSYEEAHEIGNHSYHGLPLCYTQYPYMWKNFTNNGLNRPYVCLRKGWEDIPEEPGKGNPYDEYGTSMIFVFIDPEGNIAYSNCRWNHQVAKGCDYINGQVDHAFTKEMLAETVGRPFSSTFKPYPLEYLRQKGYLPLSMVQRLLDSGTKPEDIFPDIGNVTDGIRYVNLNNKYNYITADNKLLSPEWFEWAAANFHYGVAKVKSLNGKWNYINMEGQLASEEGFTSVDDFYDGVARVEINDKWNWIRYDFQLVSKDWYDYITRFEFCDYNLAKIVSNGKTNFVDKQFNIVSDVWFDWISNFDSVSGLAIITVLGKSNYVNKKFQVLSPNQWFDDASHFNSDGVAVVALNGKYNWLKLDGQLLSDQWFDGCGRFYNGFAKVELNNEIYYINREGQLLSLGQYVQNRLDNGVNLNDLFDNFGLTREGFTSVRVSSKWNFLNTDGQLLSDQWFDNVEDFENGFARVELYSKGWNLINTEGQLVSPNQWFIEVSNFHNGFAWVELGDKWNFLNTDGHILSPEVWFDGCDYVKNGLARVQLNNKVNYIKTDGQFISEQWFDEMSNFSENGFALVGIKNKGWNFINTEGQYLSPDRWFEDAGAFREGFAMVMYDDMYNWVNRDGQIISEQWFDEVTPFRNGLARAFLYGEGWNYVNPDGQLLSDQWFEACTNFFNGFASVKLFDDNTKYYLDTKGVLHRDIPTNLTEAIYSRVKELLTEKRLLLEGDTRIKYAARVIEREFGNLLNLNGVVRSPEYYVHGKPDTTWGEYILYSLQHTFGLMTNADAKYVPLVAELAFSDEVGFEKRDDNRREIAILQEIIFLLKSNDNLFNELNKVKGNITFSQVYERLKPQLDELAKNDAVQADMVETNDDYDIYEVTSYEQAHEIGKYSCSTSILCYTKDENIWNQYTKDGVNKAYVCLRKGWKDIPEQPSEGNPYDAYGTSMIFVFIDPEGNIVASNCRWNHEVAKGCHYDGDVDHAFTKTTLARTVGRPFSTTFKPYPREELRSMGYVSFDEVQGALDNGADPQELFDRVGNFHEGLAEVVLNDKCNWVRADNGQLLSDQWFDWCGEFNEGLARVILNDKLYRIRKDGVLCDFNTKQPIQQTGLNEMVNRIVRSILSEAVTGEDGRKSSAVYAYAKNNKDEWCILAAKRNKNWDDEGGKMNPPMGHRHKYESPEDGAVRECEEESGIKFDKKDLVLASKEDWGTNFKIYLPGKTSDYKPGEGDEENTKFKWIPVSEIDNYDWAWSCGTFAKRFKPKK